LASAFQTFFDLLIHNLFILDLFSSTLAAIVQQFSPFVARLTQFGFLLLYSIASGSMILSNVFQTPAILMHQLSAFDKKPFSSLASLSSSAIIALSALFSDTHAYCDEQFVTTIFKLREQRSNKERTLQIAFKWINNAEFKLTQAKIFPGCDQIHQEFTTKRFITILLQPPSTHNYLLLSDRLLHSQTELGTNTPAFIVVHILLTDTQLSKAHLDKVYYLLSQSKDSRMAIGEFYRSSFYFPAHSQTTNLSYDSFVETLCAIATAL
jgi:hypothetical protein